MIAARRMLRFGRGTGAPWLCRQCSSSLDGAAAQTIALLRQHPGLLKEVQKRRGAEAPSTGSIAPVGRSAYDRAFAEADSDGDGHLSKDEFRQWTLRRGGQYDIGGATNAAAKAETSGSESSAAPPPSTQQLRRLALKIGIPFVGFGFLDNAIMIAAGDQIEANPTLTLTLTLTPTPTPTPTLTRRPDRGDLRCGTRPLRPCCRRAG